MRFWRAGRAATFLLLLAGLLSVTTVAWGQFSTNPSNIVGTVGGACNSSIYTYGWPDGNGDILKCVSNLWTLVTQPATAAGSTGYVQYNSSNTLAADSSFVYTTPGALHLGVDASHAGTLGLSDGSASGKTVTIQNTGATTAYNFNLPTTAGTSGYPLLSGGGSSTAMTWGSISGNTTTFGTTSGSLTSGHCVQIDSSGNLVDAGATCGGSGLTGAQYQMAYFSATNSAGGDSHITTDSGNDFIITSGNLAIGTSTVTNAINITGQGAQIIDMVRETTASTAGNNLTLQAGGSLILSSGVSTGTGRSNILFQTYPAASSTGSADNAATTILRLYGSGSSSRGAGSFGNLATTLKASDASGTDKNGGALTLSSGTSTGTGSSGMNFKVYGAGTTSSSANAATTAMTIASTGYVGIGTTSPAGILSVQGNGTSHVQEWLNSSGAVNIFVDQYAGGFQAGGYRKLNDTYTGLDSPQHMRHSLVPAVPVIRTFLAFPSTRQKRRKL